MLSVAKLSPGQERYYERSVADGLDDYYAGRGESPGVWVGRGACELELEGVVREGELGRLIGGQHPRTEEQLRRHYRARQLAGEPILKSYRLAAGYLYEAHLRAELSRSLGVEWESPRKGWAELKGIPRRVIREFSTRRAQVEEQLEKRDAGGFYAAQLAAVATRERKQHLDLAGLREDWRARAAEHGLGSRELRALIGQAPWRGPDREQLLQI